MDANIMPEYHTESPKIRPRTVLHSSLFKAAWDWIILMLVMYTAILTPYFTAFVFTRNAVRNRLTLVRQVSNLNDPLTLIEFLVDAMFLIDIAINFRTTFVDSNYVVISDPCRIASHYVRGWFIIDLLGAIPFQLLIMIGNTDQVRILDLIDI